jgi:hypothetical protein
MTGTSEVLAYIGYLSRLVAKQYPDLKDQALVFSAGFAAVLYDLPVAQREAAVKAHLYALNKQLPKFPKNA